MMRNGYSLVIACTLLGACSSDGPVSIGDDKLGQMGAALEDYAGTWTGYVEVLKFSTGSDRVHLEVDENGEGYVELGDLAAAPAATDPDTAPPSPPDASDGWNPWQRPDEGFKYTIAEANISGKKRMELAIDWRESYKSWCELQTPVPYTEDTYSCFYNEASMRVGSTCTYGDEHLPVDCTKLNLCNSPGVPCTCTSDGCSVPENPNALIHRLDVALEDNGNRLVGTFVLGSPAQPVNVRLERQ